MANGNRPKGDGTQGDKSDLWIIRDLSSGRFVEDKERGGFFTRGGAFRGVRRER